MNNIKESKRIRVMVLYGGRSGEHEISLRSAASVIRHLDRNRFEVIPVAIDKKGKWLLHDMSLIEKSGDVLPVYSDSSLGNLPLEMRPASVTLPPNPSGFESFEAGLIQLGYKEGSTQAGPNGGVKGVDVVFPVMHGPLCEDGTIQGLLELANVPYVGSGVLASAVGMDKDMSKRLIRDAGLPIVPYLAFKGDTWRQQSDLIASRIDREIGYPAFVKPANMGSSVGVHKVKKASGLAAAVEDACRYDVKILVEKGIAAREIELAVLEDLVPGNPPQVSIPGEIVPQAEFYSYDAKYIDADGAKLLIPAPLEAPQVSIAQNIARQAFQLLECEGMARVDLFLDRDTGKFYFNEVNTIPGFTSISMYPKMWEHSGIGYSELLSRLIDLALLRHQRKKRLVRDFHRE